MTTATLRKIVDRLFESTVLSGELPLLWHAGEPLTAGISFYAEAFSYVREVADRSGKSFHHAVQTNGTLITTEWCELFSHYDVRVGLSLDGPAELHNKHRRYRNGRGSHDAAIRGINIMKACGLPFEVLCVLTYDKLDRGNQIFDYFVELGVNSVSFNIDEAEGTNKNSSFHPNDAQSRYIDFMKTFMRCMERSSSVFQVREFDRAVHALLNSEGPPRTPITGQELPMLTFDIDGNIHCYCPELAGHKCSRFNDFKVGNVVDTAIDEIFQSSVFNALTQEIMLGVDKCRKECEYFFGCGGGMPANKFFEHGRFDVAETMTCRITKKGMLTAALEYLEAGNYPPCSR